MERYDIENIVYNKLICYNLQAYGSESVNGSFTILLPTVKFLCNFIYNLESGASFTYTVEGKNDKRYAFDPTPYCTSHGTTATVGINIVDPQNK